MTDYQNELVMEHLDLVNWVIRTRISVPNRPLLTYDDFYAIGCEAICRAALKYQADSGEFAPFACRYIYNAIIDHCRAMNYRLQRSVDAGFEEGEVLFDLLAHTTVDFEAEVTDDSAILLDRIKSGAQLIIVGDADQLPSVGAGNVLREMIRSEKVPTAVLETVFRQASNSRIITNAYAINHNDTHLQFGDDFQFLEVQNSEEAAQLVIKNYLQEVSLHGIEDVQILSPLRKRGAVAANALNEAIRDLVNPPNNLKKEVKCGSRVFRVGDRIMQTANRINVSNGDVGVITDMKKEDDETITCVRLLDGRTLQYTQEMLEDLEFSYCTTIHKSQGQEYPVIIVPLLKEHYIMLRRNLLYTAVTRAKAKVILIGQKQAVFVAIHKCDVGQRNTVLADRIVAYYNRELSRRVA